VGWGVDCRLSLDTLLEDVGLANNHSPRRGSLKYYLKVYGSIWKYMEVYGSIWKVYGKYVEVWKYGVYRLEYRMEVYTTTHHSPWPPPPAAPLHQRPTPSNQ
jgi:hypothetical protein